jgi:hypothetical protein
MGNTFKMKDLGEIKQFLGIMAIHESNGITLTQEHYTKEIIKKFRQDNCKGASIPMAATYQHEENEPKDDRYPIREAIGALTYLANATRPDIAYSVNIIARHMEKPTKRLWKAVQQIIKYLTTTTSMGIHYTRKTNLSIVGYTDSDFAGCKTDRKSTTGWIYKIGENTVSWKSAKQRAVTISTTEAEYYAACDAAQESQLLVHLLSEFHLKPETSPTLYQDNQGALFIEKNHSQKPRTKHIDIKYHFIKELIQEKKLIVEYKQTSEMMADIFTKPLPIRSFTKHRDNIMNYHNPNHNKTMPQDHNDTHTRRGDDAVEEEC